MNGLQKKAAKTGVIANLGLFLIKLIVGIVSNSLAVISDAINSFTDIISSTVILISVRFSGKKPDKDHPFGHSRAEPIAAIVVAIFAVILGLEIIHVAIKRIISGEFPEFGYLPITALVITIVAKIALTFYFRDIKNKTNSPAIKALMIDSRNDILASTVALAGVLGVVLDYQIFDSIAALFVAGFVIKQGYDIGKENINYLVGKAPSRLILHQIKCRARSISGVKGVHDVKAHYVGPKIHVEIHVEVDEKLSTRESHSLCKKVERKIEAMRVVNKAFVHIDPV